MGTSRGDHSNPAESQLFALFRTPVAVLLGGCLVQNVGDAAPCLHFHVRPGELKSLILGGGGMGTNL